MILTRKREQKKAKTFFGENEIETQIPKMFPSSQESLSAKEKNKLSNELLLL